MSDLSRMWFRLTGTGGSTTTEERAEDVPDHSSHYQHDELGIKTLNLSLNHEPYNNNENSSTFDKFRRASFRRKSSSMGQQPRKRSKSPHFMLKPEQSSSLEEADEMEEKELLQDKPPNIAVNSKSQKAKEKKEKIKEKDKLKLKEFTLKDKQNSPENVSIIPLSDPLNKNNNKKTTLKTLKSNEGNKKKFYKNFYNKSQSQDSTEERNQEKEKEKEQEKEKEKDKEKSTEKLLEKKVSISSIFPPNTTNLKINELSDDDDEDEDDSDTEDSESSDEKDDAEEEEEIENVSPLTPTDDLPRMGKEKIFLTDRKFRNNRIEKSSSKTKISNDIEKRESIKRSRSSRKIPTASSIMQAAEESKQQTKKSKDSKDNKKSNRPHSNLNLQALVKFVVSNKKFLNTDDFNLIRRKSISEAANAVMQVANNCKPLPIALKYPADSVVADAPKENDVKGERNVVLVKKQTLNNSFCDRFLNNTNCNNPLTVDSLKPPVKEKKHSPKNSTCDKIISSAKVKRNSSNSSKSSGNYEDEAFYSCDERDVEEADSFPESDKLSRNVIIEPKRKSSSPSLTSRVAAKINETTNNYKNRKAASKTAKKRKNGVTADAAESNERPEYYKQLNVERLNSTSIQRHPSDRRTDSANLSIRSNGNTSAHLNVSDLQSSFHGADTSMGAVGGAAQGVGGGSGGTATTPSCNDAINSTIGALSAVAQQAVGAVSPGGAGALGNLNDINAQDANEGNLRRERLHQQHQQNKSAPVSVNRSESYKERLSHKRNRSQRKTSDPNLTSRPNDDQADLGLSNSNFTASSNSSLSSGGGSESPSTSMEQMGGAGVNIATATTSIHPQQQHHQQLHHHHQHQHSHQDSFHGSIGGSSNASFWGSSGGAAGHIARHWNFESDEDDDLNEVDWSSNVAAEILSALTDAEKKRQEIINEIYQTERSHVRTLKLLERLFFYPLQDSGLLTQDHLLLLFPPSLVSLSDLHGNFEQKLKQRRLEHNHIVNSVGDLLAGMFDGKSGEELREFAAQFCARQQIALEALKEKRRKDEQLQKLLSKAESHKACRRLQLKDLLPTVLQRLTKYPLLFENLYKVTIRVVPEDTGEAEAIQKALESSKKILVDVNQAVKTAEDAHKLQNIQRKLDKSTFDKDEFKNLDLTQYRLIHDGSLTMKKNPSIQLHGLLFETMIVLLTKQDDKYSLKYLHAARNTEVNNKPVSPIMSIDSETLVRQEAADKNSFFLIKTKTSQMLELRAPSSSECKTWFKHISDAAEQYKPRSKNANQEPVDDPAIATLPHSNTRESLELTPERPPPLSATATVITTPLAPMMPMPTVSQERGGFAHSNNNNDVQLRNGRRESTPTSSSPGMTGDAYPPYYNIKQRLSHNELSPHTNAVNRTMSTRSCGDANHNYSNTGGDFAGANGVTLRHTQSARQANGSAEDNASAAAVAAASGGNKRDSASIVYSNNSNNTRTLMQSSPPLVEPTAIQISISPAHTAEPVLTPAEKLRRLDASIRDGLMEKQKIICDMFRLPVEHFHEIVDIAAMPEAPKDSTDIALAAYAQVQSLTEVINDYMKVTPEQEVSAVSTAVCDKCHEKRENQQHTRGNRSKTDNKSAAAATTSSDTPPPLPPPNKQMAQAQQQTPAPLVPKLQTCALEETNIHEDDDGYCEIDELRLPALPPLTKTATQVTVSSTPPPLPPPATKLTGAKQGSPPPPLPPPAGTFKTPPTPPPPPAKTTATNQNSSSANNPTSTPELIKRQSTISADSIPEESADEVTNALNDHHHHHVQHEDKPDFKSCEQKESKDEPSKELLEDESEKSNNSQEQKSEDITECAGVKESDIAPIATIEDEEEDKDEDSAMHTAECESAPLEDKPYNNDDDVEDADDDIDIKNQEERPVTTSSMAAEPQRQNSNATQADEISLNSEHIEINEAYECLANINKLNTALASMVDNSTQTLPFTTTTTPLPVSSITTAAITNISPSTSTGTSNASTYANGHLPPLCGPNRIQHANSLEPSVPCHALSSIVSALNNHISLLMPKISERDIERERLRKENQHLRELLNAMHERQRVEAKMETPNDITTSSDVPDDDIDGFSPATSTTPTPTPTPTTPAHSTAALGEDQTESNTTTTSSTTTKTVEAQN